VNFQWMPFAQALATGKIRAIPKDLHQRYVRAYVDLYAPFPKPRSEPPIVYTPLCGCGGATALDVMSVLGFPVHSPPDEGPDGTFKLIPFKCPNPEVPESTEPARRFADQIGSDIVLSSDPDADRVGLEVKLADGTWYHFDGNQIASVLCYALMLDPEGPRRSGLVIETLVTTKLIRRIAEIRGDSAVVDDLLVGFKYVANVLKSLDANGKYGNVVARREDLVLAAEESNGVCLLPAILDKDSTPACMLLAALYQRLKVQGRTLLDYYLLILKEVGAYDSVNRSLMMSGPEGMANRDRIMTWLRDSPPATIAGVPVLRLVDYWDQVQFGPFLSDSDRLPRNVIELHTERFLTIIRPSGTEPKIKFYCHLLPTGADAAAGLAGQALFATLRDRANLIARDVYRDLLATLGMELSLPALALPDIIEVEKKRMFDRDVAQELERRIVASSSDGLESTLSWLREVCRTLIPGADGLPALRAPILEVCRALVEKGCASRLLADLSNWART
jgi:phosphoglucomutase